jgi:hypothetical protein
MGYLSKLGMAWGIWLAIFVPAQAEPPASVDYLVLKNGAVLTGRVVKLEETYVLRSLTGPGESRYPARAVARVCTNALEVYELIKKVGVPDDVDNRCRLAALCIKYNLMKEAKLEIEAALKIDRQCVEARTLLRQWTAKQTASTTEPQEMPALPSAAILPITPASLEDWPIARVPAVFQDYTQRVQPMLMIGCGTGSCHGVSEGKRAFVLKRGLVSVPLSPLMTRTNLERVLGLLDKQDPDASDLLKKAVQPHAHVKTWPVTVEQQAALRQWVYYVTGKTDPNQKQAIAESGKAKSTDQFASGADSSSGQRSTQGNDNSGSKLPPIPGMSGGAIQQTGGFAQQSTTGSEASQPPAKSPGGLPVIPGLSGKAQNGNQPPAPKQEPPPGPRSQLKPQDQQEYMDYAKRLGYVPAPAAPKDGVPQQMKLTNAGSYRVETTPEPELPEEVRAQLKRLEEAKKNESKDKDKENAANAAVFLRMGTIVNSPPK